MRKCPNCHAENSDDAFFCHLCGRKIKNKANGWLIAFFIYFLITCVLGFLAVGVILDVENETHTLEIDLQEKESEISKLETLVKENSNDKTRLESLRRNAENENERLQSRVWEQESEISSLKNQIPQIYTTKNVNQKIYYWDGKFKETNYSYKKAGVNVTVYFWKDGFGLTEWGWIPSNCLRKN